MVDKNGKLFGKINLIDFIILVVLILAVIYVGLRATGTIGGKQVTTEPLRVTFFSNEVPDYVTDYLVQGKDVFDTATMETIGTLDSFTTSPSVGYEQSSNGVEILPPMADTCAVTLTFLVTAEFGEHGFVIDGTTYAVGHSMTIFAGEAKLYGKISGIEEVTASPSASPAVSVSPAA